jgi:DNA-binding response OmpR family regulator
MDGSGPVVAIVDDDPAVGRALKRFISAIGREAQVFNSGSAFLSGTDARLPCDVLLDFHMPGLAGAALVARARKRWPDARILVMSGLETPGAAEACLAAGADCFLRKPLDPADLKRRLGCTGAGAI